MDAFFQGELDPREQADLLFLRRFFQRLEFLFIELVMVGDDTNPYAPGYQLIDVLPDKIIRLRGVSKFLVCTGVQMKIRSQPYAAVLEDDGRLIHSRERCANLTF